MDPIGPATTPDDLPADLPARDRLEAVLTFWFGEIPGPRLRNQLGICKRLPYWSGRYGRLIRDIDGAIRGRFADDFERATRGDYDGWAETPVGRLALIVLLDQFGRNMYRGMPEAYAGDAQGLAHALTALEVAEDALFYPLARSFHYLPLMHQEDLALQDRCVALYAAAKREARGLQRIILEMEHASAWRHRFIIGRFGRFPHRNAILGRTSTPEEKRFLRYPFSAF